ncbi:unnamed protein product [Vicia faba]|uniref:Reverse transcriptase domain-containing protein n=1 Tax=Vicia faba TaxID=3906 RepID=A0AAV1ATL9_VICFA|nr:unnamed protein product [Vicia faba]
MKGFDKDMARYHNDSNLGSGYRAVLRLYLGDMHILSTTRVQQGDPLGALFFAFVLHPLIHQINDNYKLFLHVWYLDDGTTIEDSKEVATAIDII